MSLVFSRIKQIHFAHVDKTVRRYSILLILQFYTHLGIIVCSATCGPKFPLRHPFASLGNSFSWNCGFMSSKYYFPTLSVAIWPDKITKMVKILSRVLCEYHCVRFGRYTINCKFFFRSSIWYFSKMYSEVMWTICKRVFAIIPNTSAVVRTFVNHPYFWIWPNGLIFTLFGSNIQVK